MVVKLFTLPASILWLCIYRECQMGINAELICLSKNGVLVLPFVFQ